MSIYLIYAFTIEQRVLLSKEIEINIPIVVKIEENDTHGGFHGDGENLTKIYFTEKQASKIVNKIKTNEHWKKLPMPEIIENCASTSIDKGMEIPNVKKGYWFFKDRHSEATEQYEYNEIHNRASSNYSIAVFDVETNILYYSALDT